MLTDFHAEEAMIPLGAITQRIRLNPLILITRLIAKETTSQFRSPPKSPYFAMLTRTKKTFTCRMTPRSILPDWNHQITHSHCLIRTISWRPWTTRTSVTNVGVVIVPLLLGRMQGCRRWHHSNPYRRHELVWDARFLLWIEIAFLPLENVTFRTIDQTGVGEFLDNVQESERWVKLTYFVIYVCYSTTNLTDMLDFGFKNFQFIKAFFVNCLFLLNSSSTSRDN